MDSEAVFPAGNKASPSMEQIKDSLLLKVIFLTNLLVNLIGGSMHCALVLVSIRNRKFHSSCHLLIAANSLCTVLAYLAVLLPLLVFFLPPLRPSLLQCFSLQIVPLFANFHIFSLILTIGLDRLLSAFWPIWYSSRNDRLHFVLLFSASALFPLSISGIAFSNMISKPNVERACTIGELLGHRSSFVSLCCLCCMVISVSFYSAVWILLKFELGKGKFEAMRTRQQAIFRSLCIILCLQVCGWIFGQLIYAIVYRNEQRMSSLSRWHINSSVLVFLSLIAAMDVPVLYHTSGDYRTALNKVWPWRKNNENSSKNEEN